MVYRTGVIGLRRKLYININEKLLYQPQPQPPPQPQNREQFHSYTCPISRHFLKSWEILKQAIFIFNKYIIYYKNLVCKWIFINIENI